MKINLIGNTGSGKTMFGKQLSNELSIDLIEIDALFWKSNWEPSSMKELREKVEFELSKDDWILDGDYSQLTDLKWSKVDLVIWLDFSWLRTFFQLLKRTSFRVITKDNIWENTNNKESLRRTLFSKDSILLWMFKTYHKNRRKYYQMMHDPEFSDIQFIRLDSPKSCQRMLNKLKKNKEYLNQLLL